MASISHAQTSSTIDTASNAAAAATTSCIDEPSTPPPVPFNVLAYGATPNDDSDDDHYAFQTAINLASNAKATIIVPAGTYDVEVSTIRLWDNAAVRMDPNAIVKAKPSSLENYWVFGVINTNNIDISGGTIIGDRLNHIGTSGEWATRLAFMAVIM